jgi:hypothetical protein
VPTVAETAPVAPTTSASVAPTASGSPAASGVPSAEPAASGTPSATPSETPSATPAAGDGSELRPTRGYLEIDSAKPASVYVGGVFVGVTGQKIPMDCGVPKYVRLGTPPPEGASKPTSLAWLSEGKSVSVACRSVTKETIEASR